MNYCEQAFFMKKIFDVANVGFPAFFYRGTFFSINLIVTTNHNRKIKLTLVMDFVFSYCLYYYYENEDNNRSKIYFIIFDLYNNMFDK